MSESHVSEPSALGRLGQYLRALDTRGRILTVIGVLPTVVDLLVRASGVDLPIPPWAYSLWLIIAFGLANYRLFETVGVPKVEIKVNDQHFALGRWLSEARDKLTMEREIVVTFRADTSIYYRGERATDLRITVTGVGSDWVLAKKPSDLKVGVNRGLSRGGRDESNPFRLVAEEICDDARFIVELPFQAPEPPERFTYMGALSRLIVTLGVEQGGKQIIPLVFKCDVEDIHRTIEQQFISKLQHRQPDGSLGAEYFQALKQYFKARFGCPSERVRID